tara:strand:+ start:1807 stop:2217 length:411 start_codon:yes stop_codon:yes gene_type:complete
MTNTKTIDLEKTICIIKENLTTDLLSRSWINKNAKQKMAGHCYHASAVLQDFFPELDLYRGIDEEGEYHWWCQKGDEIIDITAEQYTERGLTPPYKDGEKQSRLGWSYKDKVKKLNERCQNQIENKQTTIYSHENL